MVAGNAAATRHPREIYANERTREVNRQQAERNRIQFTSIENRLADMDRMGIDIQAISPSPNQTYYGAEPELGIATARIVNDNLADYLIPVHADMPRFDVHLVPEDDPHLASGIKGIGMLSVVGVAAAIANAVYHATGRRIRDLPIRLEHFL